MSLNTLKIHQPKKLYFTSDYHFGHSNMIKYDSRPFQDVHDMETTIVENHNSVVPKDAVVIFLGDFMYGNTLKGNDRADKVLELLDCMNGSFFFTFGNHDSILLHSKVKQNIKLFDRLTLKVNDSDNLMNQWCLRNTGREWTSPYQHVVCGHYRMETWEHSFRGAWMIHGHSHGKIPHSELQFDAGIMNTKYYPVSYFQLKKYFTKRFNSLKQKNKE